MRSMRSICSMSSMCSMCSMSSMSSMLCGKIYRKLYFENSTLKNYGTVDLLISVGCVLKF